jgi:hypothetical protein
MRQDPVETVLCKPKQQSQVDIPKPLARSIELRHCQHLVTSPLGTFTMPGLSVTEWLGNLGQSERPWPVMLFMVNGMASTMEKQEQRNRTRVTFFSAQ